MNLLWMIFQALKKEDTDDRDDDWDTRSEHQHTQKSSNENEVCA